MQMWISKDKLATPGSGSCNGILINANCCGMYIPLSDDEHRFVQKVHSGHANGHWERGHNSNPVATLPHAAVVLYATI